jgi:Fic family protein
MNLRPILDRIDALKSEIDALRPIDPEQEARVRQMLRIDWNYHSNAIEGNTLTLREHLASYDA